MNRDSEAFRYIDEDVLRAELERLRAQEPPKLAGARALNEAADDLARLGLRNGDLIVENLRIKARIFAVDGTLKGA